MKNLSQKGIEYLKLWKNANSTANALENAKVEAKYAQEALALADKEFVIETVLLGEGENARKYSKGS
jgi:hypothetical protein